MYDGYFLFWLSIFCHLQMLSIWTSLKILSSGRVNQFAAHLRTSLSHDFVIQLLAGQSGFSGSITMQ